MNNYLDKYLNNFDEENSALKATGEHVIVESKEK